MLLRHPSVDFPQIHKRYTKHIQNNVTEDSFSFNQDLVSLNIAAVLSGSSSRYEHLQE